MSKEDSRWTYIHGSRPEGCIIYDDDTKLHSHHDTDPARGQNSAFDLVRLHRFGHLDASVPTGTAVIDRPSYQAMVGFAHELPEVRAQRARSEFHDLGELPGSGASTGGAAVAAGVDEPSGPARFIVRSAKEFSSGPALEWLVRSVLPRAELAVIYGESGSGKSFFALDLCAAIARGVQWRERRTVRGGVVYVCAEGASGFKARLQAYAHAHKAELAELPAVIADAPNLLETKDAAALVHSIVEWVRTQGEVAMVVIDTLSASASGGDENSGQDMGRVISHCKFIHRHTGALVVLIHHSGKDSSRGARGWSGLRAAVDAEIEIVRNGDYRVANVTKVKDGPDGASYSFKLKSVRLGFDSDGEEISSCVIEHVDAPSDMPANGKQKAGGRHQQNVMQMLKVMAPSGTVDLEDLLLGCAKQMPASNAKERSNYKAHTKRALEDLIVKGLAFMHGRRVSLTSLVQTGEDGWLQ